MSSISLSNPTETPKINLFWDQQKKVILFIFLYLNFENSFIYLVIYLFIDLFLKLSFLSCLKLG